ncbi:MAG: imidazoleglycerol-phosphate dehydratase [Sulfolobales archaeon]|nr:imidazoleglycerol-phosphate dehydratase [Sulfolobales archaeon]MDW7969946.1 imidazoleglycerol-phosphate dehydratase [Sulfolobales archaeon]
MSRAASKRRETNETLVEVTLNIDEVGPIEVSTPIPFLNHILTSFMYYMNSTAYIKAIDKLGFDDHHLVEDVAITLGDAFKDALRDKLGIMRYSSITVPMDDALILVAVDISGRGAAYVNIKPSRESLGGLSLENVPHFIDSFARTSNITIHVVQLNGTNTHHIVEATFKGLGMTLYNASRVVSTTVRSVKGSL